MGSNVWFVDPDRTIYGSIYRRLFSHDFQLELLDSAENLFNRLQQGPLPDVIVLEKYQPDMDGMRICELFRQLRTCHDIPLLLVSEAAGLQDHERAKELGAFDYIPKPFHPEHLKERVQAALSLRQTQAQLQRLFEGSILETINQKAMIQKNELTQNCDLLTKLPGAGSFQLALEQACSTILAQPQALTLTLVDLDFFAFYQEAFGAEASDRCLLKLADLLRKLAPEKSLFRYQVDRFALLMRPQDQHEALKMGQKICDRTRLLNIPHTEITGQKHLSVSVGTATLLHPDQYNAHELLESAEQALYQAKTWGRDQVRQFFEL